jgi:6-phosphogluconolactonase
MAATMHVFANAAELAAALRTRSPASLSTAITTAGNGVIAVSGGSTPKAFFQALSTRDIDWTR